MYFSSSPKNLKIVNYPWIVLELLFHWLVLADTEFSKVFRKIKEGLYLVLSFIYTFPLLMDLPVSPNTEDTLSLFQDDESYDCSIELDLEYESEVTDQELYDVLDTEVKKQG